jgi:hypothetical protein
MNDLDGNVTTNAGLEGAVDRRHSPFANFLNNFV